MADPYSLNGSPHFVRQLESFIAAQPERRAEITAALGKIERKLVQDPVKFGAPAFALPEKRLEVLMLIALPLRIFYVVDEAKRAVYVHAIYLVEMRPNMPHPSLVEYELRGAVAVLTLNRADKRNALSRALIEAISAGFERAKNDTAARCVILKAAGTVFCAGMDLAELQASLDIPVDQTPIWDDAFRLASLYDQIYACPKPTIAAIQGAAVAGGAGLVTVCDLAVSVPEAKFGYPEVRRGLVAAMVMPHLMRHVGERMSRYLLLTGELIDAETALRCGLINEVVPADRLVERAMALSKACVEGGPHALTKTKEYLHQYSHQAVPMEEAAKASAAPRLTQECQEGLRAFFAKQAPPWIK